MLLLSGNEDGYGYGKRISFRVSLRYILTIVLLWRGRGFHLLLCHCFTP